MEGSVGRVDCFIIKKPLKGGGGAEDHLNLFGGGDIIYGARTMCHLSLVNM